MRSTPILLVLLMGSLAFAGCLGGDDAPAASEDDDLADQAVATDETGSITGQVVANDLEVISGAQIGLIQGGAAVADTTTDKQGKFTINGVEPGAYRVQVSSVCCKAGLKEVTVVAGEVTEANFQLARLTADDLQTPFISESSWTGFIACGVGAGVPGVTGGASLAACSLLSDTPVEDPNEDFRQVFNWSKGVQDAVFALDWNAVGGVSGTEFWFLVENSDCSATSCSYTYVDEVSAETIIAHVPDEEIAAEWKWSAIEDSREMAFRIFASPMSPNAMYQQPFTVYYTAFYHQDAPEDYNPIPDM